MGLGHFSDWVEKRSYFLFLIPDSGVGTGLICPDEFVHVLDNGSGAEGTPGILAQLSLSDAGEAIGKIIAREFQLKETGALTDLVKDIQAQLSVQDTGSGVDVPVIWIGASDLGIGVDRVLERGFIIPDTGSGVESFLHAWDAIIIIG